MEELDDSGTYYDLGPRKVTQSGTYNYMSTRNNNFSNRSQKGTIIILNAPFVEQSVDQRGGSIALKNPTTLVVSFFCKICLSTLQFRKIL